MGFEAGCSGTFKILPDKVKDAYLALMKLISTPEGADLFYLRGDKKIADYTLLELFQAAGFVGSNDALGGIADLVYEWAKFDQDLFGLFRTIAGFVHSGSHLDWAGDEDTHWRWLFENQNVREQEGSIVYADPK